MSHVDILFDGPPGPVCGRFVETEDAERHGISIGEWVERDDGLWALRIPDPRLPTQAFTVTINTETLEEFPADEIASILRKLASEIDDKWWSTNKEEPLLDANGNTVGQWTYTFPGGASETKTCKHCGRAITLDGDRWVDPEATGDDVVWRETCESHDTFKAQHEPESDS